MGFPAIALTDHGHMSGCINLYEGCTNKGEYAPIKPIFGIEAYYTEDLTVKQQVRRKDGKIGAPVVNHLTLLSENQTGYRNLMRASSIAAIEGFYYKPRMDWNLLTKHSEGVIALSGCLASEFSQYLLDDDYEGAKGVASRYKDVFGDRYFIELHYHKIALQKQILKNQVKIAKELDIPIVMSNDVHYINADDATTHELLIRMRDLSDGKLDAVGKREAYETKQFWLKSEQEMFNSFRSVMPEEYIRTAMRNTLMVADRVENFMKLNQFNLLPKAVVPTDDEKFQSFWKKYCKYDTANQAYLYYLAAQGLTKLGLAKDPVYRKALDSEYKTYIFMGIEDYLLLQAQTVEFMRERGIRSLARGSASGSLILYCLGVTNVDPLKYDLMPERFVNPGRGSQFDLDFSEFSISDWKAQYSSSNEDKANQYLNTLIDESLSNPDLEPYHRMIEKEAWVAINEELAGYYYHLKQNNIKLSKNDKNSWIAYLSGLTDEKPKGDLIVMQAAGLPDIDTDIEDVKRIDVFCHLKEKFGDDKVANIGTYNTYQAKAAIQNAIKATESFQKEHGAGLAAYAMTISKMIPFRANPPMTLDDAAELSPQFKSFALKYPETFKQAKGVVGAINSMGVHAAGVLVSSEPLTDYTPLEVSKGTVCSAYDMGVVEKVGLVKYDLLGSSTLTTVSRCLDFIEKRHGKKIDLQKVNLDDPRVFNIFKQGKLSSVFQFSSFGMKSAIQTVSPDSMEDLIAINALYRPGPMDYIADYAKGKKNPNSIHYSHPVIKKHLSKTYGIMVYQEQAMFLAREMGKLTWKEVDKLRKGIAKKSGKDFEAICNLFREKAIANGYEPAVVDEVLHLMEKFGGYAFNKSHATAYSVLAYQTAWLRTYYPSEWLASSIEMDKDDNEKLAEYFDECRLDGIKIVQPNVNTSGMVTGVDAQGRILLPLTILKHVGSSAVSVVDKQPYEDFKDFVFKAGPDKKMVEVFAENLVLDCFDDCKKKHPAEIMLMFEQYNKEKKRLDKIMKDKANAKYKSLSEDIFSDNEKGKKQPPKQKPKDKFLKGLGGKDGWFDDDE